MNLLMLKKTEVDGLSHPLFCNYITLKLNQAQSSLLPPSRSRELLPPAYSALFPHSPQNHTLLTMSLSELNRDTYYPYHEAFCVCCLLIIIIISY